MAFSDWARDNAMFIDFIESGRTNQNAYVERFNRTYREEVLDLYLFRTLGEVREITGQWFARYNETWPQDALDGLSPFADAERARLSTYCLLDGDAYARVDQARVSHAEAAQIVRGLT